MTEFEFELSDRITKIKSMSELYDLEHKAFISFSGGEEYKQCWILWGKVYKEYERLNYRLTLN